MIQLLQNKLVKGAVLTLVSCVMLFGSFFLGGGDAHAQVTSSHIQDIFSATMNGPTEITNGSVYLEGTIIIQNEGEIVEEFTIGDHEVPENRFYQIEENVLWENRLFKDYAITTIRYQEDGEEEVDQGITSFRLNIYKESEGPASGITSLSDLLLGHPETFPDNKQRFNTTIGDLEPSTTYKIDLIAKTELSLTSSPSAVLVTSSSFTTLAENEGPQPAESEDFGGVTDLEGAMADLVCSISKWNFTDCMVEFMYNALYTTSSGILIIAAKLFDLLTSLAISSKVYRDSTFVISGWSIVRDISNIFFIFVLLIAAFRTMFGSSDIQKTIKNVIVVALLINFSLFMVRVVIDGSNILAHLFYNRISVVGADGVTLNEGLAVENISKNVALSEGIGRGLDIQNFIAGPGVTQFLQEIGNNVGTLALIVILGIIVNVMAAWIFFQVGFMMLGRIIGLWMAMILAPLAFIMKLAPGAGAYLPNFSFDRWMKDMVQYALLAPVFLFFVYLIILFINSNFLDGFLSAENYESFERLIVISLSFMFILGLLKVAKKTASDMAGEAGNMIAGAATKAFGAVAGVAGGVALGGAAVAGRTVIGGAATAAMESGKLQEWSKKGGISGWMAKQGLKTADGATKSSFDVRSSGIGKNIQSSLNEALGTKINMNNDVVGAIGYGSDKGAGGLAGIQKKKEEEQKAYAKLLELKGEGAVQQDEKNKAWQDKYQASLAEAQKKAKKAKVNLNEGDFRKQYEKGEDFSLRDNLGRTFKGGTAFKGGEAYVKTAKEVGAENKKAFAEKLNRGGDSFLGAAMESGAVAKSAMGIGGLVGGGSAVSNISAIAGTAGVSGAAAVTGVAALAGVPKFDEVFTQGRADRAVAREILGAEKKKEKAGVNLADLKKLLTDAKARTGATAGESDSDALKGMAATLKAQQEIQKAQLDLAKKEYLLAFKAHQASPTDPALKAEVDRHEKTFMDISLKHTELGDRIGEYKNFSNNEEKFTKLLKGEDPEK